MTALGMDGLPIGECTRNPDLWTTTADEQAKAILFLVSDDSSFIIGENLFVDGGTMAMDQTGH